jgi:hypothetical protein
MTRPVQACRPGRAGVSPGLVCTGPSLSRRKRAAGRVAARHAAAAERVTLPRSMIPLSYTVNPAQSGPHFSPGRPARTFPSWAGLVRFASGPCSVAYQVPCPVTVVESDGPLVRTTQPRSRARNRLRRHSDSVDRSIAAVISRRKRSRLSTHQGRLRRLTDRPIGPRRWTVWVLRPGRRWAGLHEPG